MQRILRILPALVLAVFGWGAENRPSVILISVDTLRADRLGCYGSRFTRTPHIDAIANGGTRFSNVSSQVPLTLPSHVCLLTSTYPFANGVRDNGQALSSSAVTLAGILKKNGYRTAAFVASFVLDRRFGLNQGFDLYSGVPSSDQPKVTDPGDLKRPGEDVIKAATDWLKQNHDHPFFLFLHLYDLHTPYSIPHHNGPLSYNEMLAYEDNMVGRFWDVLRTQQILNHALVVFVSDHGESLGDHHESTHGYFVYQSTIHVPLIIHWPNGRNYAGVINAAAGLIDVAPTVLEYIGVREPGSFQGRSLMEFLQSKPVQKRSVYTESLYAEKHFGCSPLRTVQEGDYKYIDSAKPELYRLTDDPGEQRNIYSTNQSIALEYRQRLQLFTMKFGKASAAGPSQVSTGAISKLRSLGYLAGTATPTDEMISRPAPADRIDEYEEYGHALGLSNRGHVEQAIAIMNELLKLHPDLVDVRLSMGLIRQEQGSNAAAAQEFRDVLKQEPTNALAHCDLGMCLLSLGNSAQAEREFDVALTLEPYYTRAEELLASELLRQKRFSEAQHHFQHILQNDPTNFDANYSLGALAAAGDRAREADAYLTVALQTNPGSADAHNVLGSVELKEGRLGPAEREFREAVDLSPKFSMAHYNLGLVLQKNGHRTAALREFRLAAESDPHNEAAREALQ